MASKPRKSRRIQRSAQLVQSEIAPVVALEPVVVSVSSQESEAQCCSIEQETAPLGVRFVASASLSPNWVSLVQAWAYTWVHACSTVTTALCLQGIRLVNQGLQFVAVASSQVHPAHFTRHSSSSAFDQLRQHHRQL